MTTVTERLWMLVLAWLAILNSLGRVDATSKVQIAELDANTQAKTEAKTEAITPLLLKVHAPPIPFAGSDGRTHLVYELWMTNFSNGNATIEQVEVLGDGSVVQALSAAEIATRLQLAGQREPTGTMPAGTVALLFVHVMLPEGSVTPKMLTHRVRVRAMAAPPGKQEMDESGAETKVGMQLVVVIGPPLRGPRYIAADSCCNAMRHTRAALPVNGDVWIAQRYAVDWEQMDSEGRIYHGLQTDVKSYEIYGKEVLAVADAKVVSAIDHFQDQTPGKMPTNIAIEEADGNSVVLDLGGGRYGLYAHLEPGSVRVHAGDMIKRGKVIGLVGNTGNSLAPHLHFHVMSEPVPLASNGLPYEIDDFLVTGSTPGTAAFDEAEAKGTPLEVKVMNPPRRAKSEMPLDQTVISFGN